MFLLTIFKISDKFKYYKTELSNAYIHHINVLVIIMKVYEMTTIDFKNHVDDETLAIVPYGILEEHGPHLPIGTDTIQAIHMVDMLEEELEKKGVRTIVLPPVHYGQSSSIRNFPGTITIRSETLYALSYDILTELVRQGLKNILVLSGHAGSIHMKAIERAGHDVVDEHDEEFNLMILSDYFIAYELLGKTGIPEDDGHAGTIETARVFEARPDLVKQDRMENIRPSKKLPDFRIVKYPENYIPDGIIGLPPVPESIHKGKEINRYILDKLILGILEMLKKS